MSRAVALGINIEDECQSMENIAEVVDVLCAERVSQMTRTYNDIEAVTRLLEEKENDLELAARIGQGLLEHNKKLEAKNEALEEQYTESLEKNSQLRHELNMKDALLQTYTEDYELELDDSTSCLPERFTLGKCATECEILEKKVKKLQDENVQLRNRTEQLATETCDLEEKEVTLVSDCVRQLDEANHKVRKLQDELHAKGDVCVAQQEENTNLLCKVITVETNFKRQLAENADLQKQMKEMQATQQQLTHELIDLEEKYNECMALLNEKSEEIKTLKKKANPSVIHQHYGTSPFYRAEGSLLLELEKSETEEACPQEYKMEQRKKHLTKVLETAKAVNKTMKREGSMLSLSSASIQSGAGSGEEDSTRSSICGGMSDAESGWSDSFSQTDLLDSGAFTGGGLGRVGVPGSNDLETAIRRLAIREANEINQSLLEEQDKQNQNYSLKAVTGNNTPTPCPTPDSYMSTESGSNMSEWSRLSGAITGAPGVFRVPEKLQIIKPMEGSLTLHQWQRLATPRLEGVLEIRPGVQIRGEKMVEMDEEIYTLSDCEEDDDMSFVQGKPDDSTAGTYTYTTSKVLHPTDEYVGLVMSSMQSESKVSATEAKKPTKSTSAKRPTSLALLKTTQDGHDGTSTFSMSFSLAAMLHERGLKEEMQKYSPRNNVKNNQGLLSKVTSWISAPKRFSSITTETPAETPKCKTETIYTQSSTKPENAYLNLVNKVRELGLSKVIGSANNSGISPVKKDPIDVGLNTMMHIRRNRVTGAPTRASAQTLVSSNNSNKTKSRALHSKKWDSKNSSAEKSNLIKTAEKIAANITSMESNSSKESVAGSSSRWSALKDDGGLALISDISPKIDNNSTPVSGGGFLSDLLEEESSSNGVKHRATSAKELNSKKDDDKSRPIKSEKSVNNKSASMSSSLLLDSTSESFSSSSSATNGLSRVDQKISHSHVRGLGYAVSPPNFGGSASMVRNSVYTSMATGRGYSVSGGGHYNGYTASTPSSMVHSVSSGGSISTPSSMHSVTSNSSISTPSSMRSSSISDNNTSTPNSGYDRRQQQRLHPQAFNVGTGTIHSPITKDSYNTAPTSRYSSPRSAGTGNVSLSTGGLLGSAVEVMTSVKPRSNAVIGGLTSTPIMKSTGS